MRATYQHVEKTITKSVQVKRSGVLGNDTQFEPAPVPEFEVEEWDDVVLVMSEYEASILLAVLEAIDKGNVPVVSAITVRGMAKDLSKLIVHPVPDVEPQWTGEQPEPFMSTGRMKVAEEVQHEVVHDTPFPVVDPLGLLDK